MPVVHDCVRAEHDVGLPFECKCFRQVALGEAVKLIRDGHATWKKQKRADGRVVEIKSAIIMRHEKRPPRARTISDRDIEHAYLLGSRREKERIDCFGALREPPLC